MAMDHQERCNKRRKGEIEEHGSSKTELEALPREILAEIFSLLPITSLVQFKFVSRSWRSLTQDPLLLNAVLSSSRNPCLLLHCDFPLQNELHYIDLSSHRDSKTKIKRFNIPFRSAMPEFDVVSSCNGLLCLLDSLYKDSIYVYNPFTRNCIELPESANYHDRELVFGFGFHPRTKQYKVVKVVYYRSGNSNISSRARRIQYPQSEVQIFTMGSSSWRSLGKAPYQFMRQTSDALVNGRLHFVTRPRRAHRLISFDLADEEFREISRPDPGGLNKFNCSVTNLKGCLSAVFYRNYGKLDIWVMKTYNVEESWTKEYSIRAYMPKGLKQNLDRYLGIWNSGKNVRAVRVLCVLENGEIVLEYKSRVLVLYDPEKGEFKDLAFEGMPNRFHTVVHSGTLNWVDMPLDV